MKPIYSAYVVIIFILIGFLFLFSKGVVDEMKENSQLSYATATPVVILNQKESYYNYTALVQSNIQKLKNLKFYRPPKTVPPLVRRNGNYRVAPAYNATVCIIEKSMCTMMQGIFCYLYDTEGWVKNNRSIVTEPWSGRFCQDRNEAETTPQRKQMMLHEHKTLVVIRDPFERFMSGFMDKCVNEKYSCFGCNTDIFCVIEALYNDVMNLYQNNYDVRKARGEAMKVDYLTQHAAPQTWHCDLYDESPNYYFVKYGESGQTQKAMSVRILDFLRSQGVENHKLDYISDSLTGSTTHATKLLGLRREQAKKLRDSRKHMEILVNLYYYDYLAFDIQPPFELYDNSGI